MYRPLRKLPSNFRYLRLRPFSTNDENGRASERYRLAALGAVSTAISRLAGVAVILLSVRWVAPVLGDERFGLWATFSTLAVMLSFLDLGVGNALVNRVAEATARQDSHQLSLTIMGGISWLTVIGLISAAALALGSIYIPWIKLFKLSTADVGTETLKASLVFSGLFGLGILANGLLKILAGQQRNHEAQMISMVGSLLACSALWWTTAHKPNIGWLLFAGIGTQSLTVIVVIPCTLWLRHHLRVGFLVSSMAHERRSLINTSFLFFVLQIGIMVGWGGDSFLLAGIAGASEVASFAVAQRLFLFASQPVSILNSSLWAAYADAYNKGDQAFIRTTLFKSLTFSLIVATGISLFLLVCGRWIVAFWTRNSIVVPWPLFAAFAIWTPIESAGSVLSIYLNGTGVIRPQVVVVTCFCIVAIPAKILATMHAGPIGLVVATTIVYLISELGLYGTVFLEQILAPMRKSGIHSRLNQGAEPISKRVGAFHDGPW